MKGSARCGSPALHRPRGGGAGGISLGGQEGVLAPSGGLGSFAGSVIHGGGLVPILA